jgi:2-amino-4-hydroxy-6-hydroxymethyldihydropteridine diphosphokinase
VSKLNADVYIGLGANMGTPRETFEKSLEIISTFAKVEKVSRLYQSAPLGFSDQPPFINAAVRINTTISPAYLLSKLQEAEKKLGKKVLRKNGPRIIDLDLLLYANLTLKSEDLILPHPGILTRDFVLRPLHDLNPNLSHPDWGSKTLKSALSGLQERFVEEQPQIWNYPA